ncbi:dolichyl-phosphate-mannose-protein mannosyltransferase activity [Nesidiocoris tenuis]|uniref:dolichyl-phosphate-mannose--protein mannosyltransferase n=1 Tax=Nesidiocoris tenuis TaxID=355587 RepID=A0ABN7ALN3_9HEMI|nr:dolichyl-phosphate-mannose-protein mannosyltransferase activity [Nesidiocoris tenuis]
MCHEKTKPAEEHRSMKTSKKTTEKPQIRTNDIPTTVIHQTWAVKYRFNVEIDMVALLFFIGGLMTRFYRLSQPKHIVFDELHFGKYVGMYMKNTFFFDLHPPLGKLLVSVAATFADFNGKFKFDKIGSPYDDSVPIFALRFIPALCGSLIIPTSYLLLLELGCRQWTAALGAFLLLFDNAFLTQSRFILMEPILLLFTLLGLLYLLKYRNMQLRISGVKWWSTLSISLIFLSFAFSVKYIGFSALALGVMIVWRDFWFYLLPNKQITNQRLVLHALLLGATSMLIPLLVYVSVFHIHLSILSKAGPHDSIMTSAFQASLEGGLASITKGQPLEVAHGSQITLRHTHGKACWLHSHAEVYPIRYPDKRGSSHQQQVTCYTFKDLNNWWIVRRPDKSNLVVSSPPDAIKHGDIIHLIHGITGRALNSHDVSAPMSPHNQEVSCYVDYNISMPAQNLWKVDIINRNVEGDVWHTIQSQVRLIHVNSSQALKYSGRQLPSWGYNQMEIVTDQVHKQDDTVWNVEEHRYTKFDDEKERERDLMNAEMIPLQGTKLSRWAKFVELQYKMLFPSQENIQNHMYSSDPLEWPLMTRGIAYWVSSQHNGQIHLIGNVAVWYAGTLCLAIYACLFIFYLLRRRRRCYDIDEGTWNHFVNTGLILFCGFLFHYLPYFFIDRTMFLHHYFPALMFKLLLTAVVIEHLFVLLSFSKIAQTALGCVVIMWMASVGFVFVKFSDLSYGLSPLTSSDVARLRWFETWDLIIHKE